MPKLDPKLAGWWNVVICGCLVVFPIVQAARGYPTMLFLLVVAIPMEVFFIRRLIKAYQPVDDPNASASTGVHPTA